MNEWPITQTDTQTHRQTEYTQPAEHD